MSYRMSEIVSMNGMLRDKCPCFYIYNNYFYSYALMNLWFSCFAAFVKGDKPAQFPGLKVRYPRGADPIIKLLDESRNVQQTFGIEKWDTDTIEAFLQSRLQQ